MKPNRQSKNRLNCAPDGARQVTGLGTELSKETLVALAKIDENILRAGLHGNEFLVD